MVGGYIQDNWNQKCTLKDCLRRIQFYKIWWGGSCKVVIFKSRVVDEIFEYSFRCVRLSLFQQNYHVFHPITLISYLPSQHFFTLSCDYLHIFSAITTFFHFIMSNTIIFTWMQYEFFFMPFVYVLQLIVGTLMWEIVINSNLNASNLSTYVYHRV